MAGQTWKGLRFVARKIGTAIFDVLTMTDEGNPRLRVKDDALTDGTQIAQISNFPPTPEIDIVVAIEEADFDLSAAPYSVSSTFVDDFILNKIELKFSTTASRHVLITRSDGSVFFDEVNDLLDLDFEEIDEAYDAGENFTIDITQTGGPCDLTVRAVVLRGSQNLGGGAAQGPATSLANAWPVKVTDGTDVLEITNEGAAKVEQVKSTTSTSSSPLVEATETTVFALNLGRRGGTVYNEGGAVFYLLLGTGVTLTNYTLPIAVGGYYEVPFGYTGAITGITASGTAQLRCNELS